MKVLQPSMKVIMSFFFSHSFIDIDKEFLIRPISLRWFSGSLHVLLLLLLFISWLRNKISINRSLESRNHHRVRLSQSVLLYYKPTLVCCLALSLFNLVLSLLVNFYWYRNGTWSDEQILSLLDLVLRTVSWFAVSVYLHAQLSSAGRSKYPLGLRVWWGVFFLISCYCLGVDYVCYKRHQFVPMHFFLSDVVSTIMGMFFCFVGLIGNCTVDKDTLLQEPLLDGGDRESNRSNGVEVETVGSYFKASIFSAITFSWLDSLIALGNKKTLDIKDVPDISSFDSASGAFPVLRNKLESELGRTNRVTAVTLVKALIMTTWKEIILTGILALLYSFAIYVGPLLIDTFVQYVSGHQRSKVNGYMLVSAFFGGKLVESLAQKHWHFKLQQASIRIRAALVAMIYNKSLTLSCQAKQVSSSGEIVNLMTVDTQRICDFSWYIHDPWTVLLEIALALAILYKNLGLASVSAFIATVIIMFANVPLGGLQEKLQGGLMKSKDKRMKATSEILSNMKILKLQGWEIKFLSKINELREVEVGWLRKYVYTMATLTFVFWGAPTFVAVVTFGTCVLFGIPLESGKILSALATLKMLSAPIYVLPDVISMFAQTKVSLDRIATFLRLDDLQVDVIESIPNHNCHTAIEIVDGNFSWDVDSTSRTLNDINFTVSSGMRVAVCGTVGSGKSSLLACILGEVPKVSGTVKICGTKSYVAQTPWIQSGTIEENILFGKDMDKERYEKVLGACSLKKDLEILSFGDQTVIGERGINLSGGQKQRIQIARALYQDGDIYLFDDPFSAVDAHTGSHLFEECLLGLLSSKTVIYVTHQVEFLPAADLILVMREGNIVQAGKYNDILNSGSDFMELVGAHKEALSALDSIEVGCVSRIASANPEGKEKAGEEQNGKADGNVEPKGQLVQEEEREKGKVGFSVYWKYITTAYGGALVPIILLAQVLFQLLGIGSNYWMAWATPLSKDQPPPVNGSTLIIVFIALAIGSAFCILCRALLLMTAGYKTATILFNKMHLCIFRAPMSFFDATPSGRILSRASTDQSALDLNIPSLVGSFAFAMIQLLAAIGVISQVAWQVIFIFVPAIATCMWLQKYYISSARELARLAGVCKAPVIQHFAETISGSTTIRSFDQESRFRDTNMKLIDKHSRPCLYNAGAMEWLCFRMEMLSSVTFAFSLIFLISIPEGTIDPSLAGLAVVYGLNLNTLLANVVWSLSCLENQIISVERILQYTSIPSEPPLVIESNRPEANWPSHGEVDICNLQVRYAPHLPLVLRGISCTFHGGLKTGIVGRTGSGKSTLIQTLLRIVDPTAGKILIDSTDISMIGLHDLRSRLSIIPQDPTMFEGTVRCNLDPLEEFTDEEIWEALDKCQLGDEIRKKETKLDSTVTENGDNWSVGQRQLVCLGRVLLKKSKILVLDEATASVDTATDSMIQQTLDRHFSDSTVITIAHRITSVLHSDMVLLLDNGCVDEYDSPAKLLECKSSSFSKLVAEYSLRSSSSFQNLARL